MFDGHIKSKSYVSITDYNCNSITDHNYKTYLISQSNTFSCDKLNNIEFCNKIPNDSDEIK